MASIVVLNNVKKVSLQILAAEAYIFSVADHGAIHCLFSLLRMVRYDTPKGELRRIFHQMVSSTNGRLERSITKPLARLVAVVNEVMNTAPKSVAILLRRHVSGRAEMIESREADVILQLIFSNTFVFQEHHIELIMLLSALKIKFPRVTTLLSYQYSLCYEVLDVCLPMMPNLTEIRALVDDKLSSLRVIRDQAKNLERLFLPALCICTMKNDDMSRLFFKGTALKLVTERFSLGENLPLSFPKLKHLALPFKFPESLPLFKMLLHYYKDCNFEWHYMQNSDVSVSLFDSALCPTIELNHGHGLKHCELRYEDLRFPYIDDVLTKWTNLQSLLLVISGSSATIDHEHARSKLTSILKNCSKLKLLQVCVLSSNVDKCFENVVSVFRQGGVKIKELCLIDSGSGVSHERAIMFLNCFPNITNLTLHLCHRPSYKSTLKLKGFSKLVKFKLVIADPPITPDYMFRFFLFIIKILELCPNLQDLTLPMEHIVLNLLKSIQSSFNLRTLNCHVCCNLVDMNFVVVLTQFIIDSSIEELSFKRLTNVARLPPDLAGMAVVDREFINSDQMARYVSTGSGVALRYHDRACRVQPW
ncbi:uncharacterized protein LOC108666003 [Hyalella azteca]|uniref:Uncharacterized protein LOC108666003 n=1 Tax=Hyalella azteca TaxID=294128 RepID=A0A8B7N368_HYAAZ|nr:uncharacterized protein LOC108666003 [Hyalella azteca]